ncbi:hypothetical protein ACTXMY_06175 [Glutamicibacter ardleyensis]|uniref:hypothetical protein n=1 Tax=Glutamicibacter ardleyensis TaxID=225894 RepID=UPI003FD36E37
MHHVSPWIHSGQRTAVDDTGWFYLSASIIRILPANGSGGFPDSGRVLMGLKLVGQFPRI